MTENKNRDYANKCGSCKFFSFAKIHGKKREWGYCDNLKRVISHQANQKACKLYERGRADAL